MRNHIATISSIVVLCVSSGALGKSCRPDEVEVFRNTKMIKCVDRAKHVACIRAAGEDLKKDVEQTCGDPIRNCLLSKKVDASVASAGCLAGALAGCGAGKAQCAVVCGVVLKAGQEAAVASCTADATPCYEAALVRDKERKQMCNDL